MSALGLALLPVTGTVVGGLLAECFATSARSLSRALHVAAGIVVAVVAVEVMPSALPSAPGWAMTLAFVLGGCFYLGVDWVVDRLQARKSGDTDTSSAWMIYFAVSMDLFSDGLLIGAGAAASPALGLALAVGQVLADLPEGFATIINFRDKGFTRGRRFALSASFAMPALLAAGFSYVALRGRGEALQMAAVVFTAGPLVVGAVEEMIREAHARVEDTRVSVLCFVGGFALFTFVSTSLDG